MGIGMGLLNLLIVGITVGGLSGMVINGNDLGLLGNIVIGIIGALAGGLLADAVFNIPNAISAFTLTTLIVAFLGAVIALYLSRFLNDEPRKIEINAKE